MFRFISVYWLSVLTVVPAVGAGEPNIVHGEMPFETCLQAALDTRSGMVIKVEMKTEDERYVYEFDIRDNQARDWDIECEADTGEIIEIEREVTTPRHPDFQAWMKVSEAQAREAALEVYPGEIIEVEYEIEADGRAVYEFDIKQKSGVEMKVEIDAGTGEIHEANQEHWQIGYE